MNRPCRTCGAPTPYTYCAAHGLDGRHRRSVEHGVFRSHWRAKNGVRARVLARDGYRCRLQLKGCTIVATTVHLDPVLRGNHDIATENDCLSACRSCHGRVDGARSHENR